jgi:uridylate kinase
MKKKVIVLSLGGSIIIPDEIDTNFLRKFKKVILKNSRKYRFVIVCGGGSIARKYINSLKEIGLNEEMQSYSGISATRMNARFMSYFFNLNPREGIPHTLKTVRKYLKREDVVFCGALEYRPKQTSDSTAVEIASYFKSIFINLTKVPGLYDKNPEKFRNARFIPKISWKDFLKMANREKYRPGQHFVLDQTAAAGIMKKKIPAYIIGRNVKNLDSALNNRKFRGTIIQG